MTHTPPPDSLPVLYAVRVHPPAIALYRDVACTSHVATIFDGATLYATFLASDGWRVVPHRIQHKDL